MGQLVNLASFRTRRVSDWLGRIGGESAMVRGVKRKSRGQRAAHPKGLSRSGVRRKKRNDVTEARKGGIRWEREGPLY